MKTSKILFRFSCFMIAVTLLTSGELNASSVYDIPLENTVNSLPQGIPDDPIYLSLYSQQDKKLTIEKGPLGYGANQHGQAAQWTLKPTGEQNFYYIRNAWKSDHYLHTQNSLQVECTTIDKNWWSAMWEVIPIPNTGHYALLNRWRQFFMVIDANGSPVLEKNPNSLKGAWAFLPLKVDPTRRSLTTPPNLTEAYQRALLSDAVKGDVGDWTKPSVDIYKAGRANVYNGGGYVLETRVYGHSRDGKEYTVVWKNVTVGTTFSPDAYEHYSKTSKLYVRGIVHTGLVWDPKRVLFDIPIRPDAPLCINTWGTTLDAKYEVVPCSQLKY